MRLPTKARLCCNLLASSSASAVHHLAPSRLPLQQHGSPFHPVTVILKYQFGGSIVHVYFEADFLVSIASFDMGMKSVPFHSFIHLIQFKF